MILSSETTSADAQQMLEFYKQNFAVVEVVTCGKCGSFLALECSGGDSMGLAPNELGKYVISIGDNLLSHRVRLDEAPTGERMIGYQCGAPVPNPLFPAVKREYEKNLADYEKKYAAEQADYSKKSKQVIAKLEKKPDADVAMPTSPVYDPPVMPPVPEMIECGNDTRISDAERGLVPVGAMQTSLSPFEKHQIREKILQNTKHKPDFKKVGNTKHFETFTVERVT
jgi:hypothetical protein